jgi:predicted N-acyltransferase
LSDDTAAALSQLGTAPRNWRDVTIYPAPDRGYLMVVTTKRGAVRTTILPDSNSLSEVGSLMKTHYLDFVDPEERARLEKEWTTKTGQQFMFNVEVRYGKFDTFNDQPQPTKPTTGRSLPRRKR